MLISYRPGAPLARYIDHLWFSRRDALPHDRERALPTGRTDIVIPLLQETIVRFAGVASETACHFRGGIVSGPHDRHTVRGMGGASCVIGVCFRPGGASAFFDGALPGLRNRTELLENLWGPPARELRERLQSEPQTASQFRILEAALMLRLAPGLPGDNMVDCALRALEAEASAARIARVQGLSGCTPAHFIRRFERAVGLTPKRYARVLRFSALLPGLARVGPRDWAQVAADGGFYDQSHLIHEFKRLAGITPVHYLPLQAQPTHVPIAPSAGEPFRKKVQYVNHRTD